MKYLTILLALFVVLFLAGNSFFPGCDNQLHRSGHNLSLVGGEVLECTRTGCEKGKEEGRTRKA